MKRQILLSILGCFVSVLMFGQDKPFAVGFMVQPGYSEVSPSLLNNQKYSGDWSIGVGLTFNYQISKKWTLQSGIAYSTLRDKYEENELRWGTQHDGQGGFEDDPSLAEEQVTFKYNHYFLDLFVGMRYYFNDGRFRAFVFPLMESNVYLSNRYSVEFIDGEGNVDSDQLLSNRTTAFRNVNLSAGLGLGLEMAISQQFNLILMPSFKYMLLGMSTDSVVKVTPRFYNIGARLGVEYQF